MEMQDAPHAKARLSAAMGMVLMLTFAAAFFAIGIRSQKTMAPKQLVKYVAPDKSFVCVLPEDWKREETSSGAIGSSVRASSGAAYVSIYSDLSGSLMADIARASDAQMSNITSMVPGAGGMPGGQRAPVEKLHIAYVDKMENKWDEFDDSDMKPLQVSLGDARVSEWSGVKKDLVGADKTRGLRATILSGERLVTVLCYCSENDWKIMVPTFSKIIRSMSPGGN